MTHPRSLFDGCGDLDEVMVITRQPQANPVFTVSRTAYAMQTEQELQYGQKQEMYTEQHLPGVAY